ncbi:DEKNAAC105051 [Brettanomyces naardenensis]|uniref:Acireductone dioxygenase n=1 Tax=Brettanomyces naardenensis TaxID=13370 RepID=A0A448YS72_BRENA|nr:DEKNAAC105051 [Brettanomyces naardenensis]
MAQFYYYDEESNAPYTEDHNSGKAVSGEQLAKLGVFYRFVEDPEGVEVIAKERKYKNRDTIVLDEKSFPGGKDALNAKLDLFFQEHLHEDEEIRYILDGEGYFDVRDADDKWVRAKVFKGDLLIIPAGIFHRFTLSTTRYIKALRLFRDQPKWEALQRSTAGVEKNQHRKEYLRSISAN